MPFQPGRVVWHDWSGKGEQRLDVHYAWRVEDIFGSHACILAPEHRTVCLLRK
jgi:hypothetical protein